MDCAVANESAALTENPNVEDVKVRMEPETKIVTGDHKRGSFLVVIPTLGTVDIAFMVAFSRLAMPMNAKHHSLIVSKMEVGQARQYAAEYALAMKPRPEFILFLGDDNIPPWNAVHMLYQAAIDGGWDVLTGLYHIKNQGMPVPLAWRKDVIGWLKPNVHYTPGEVVSVDHTGMDCTLVRVSLFDRMTAPYFKTGPSLKEELGATDDGKSILTLHTEDIYFLERAKAQANAKVGVHTGVKVGHLDTATGEVY